MADLASLLQQLQPRHRDPLEQQRKYAQLLMQQGGSTEPVRTPLQGAARALQGGIGGLLSGYAYAKEDEDKKADVQGLADLLSADTTEKMAAAASKLRNPDIAAPILAQALAERQKMMQAQKAGGEWRTAVTAPPPGTQSAGPQVATAALPAPAQGDAAIIAGIESKGQPNGGYDAIGPAADAKGSRAHGKYQVMDFNIGPWTQEILGKAMTPDEFRANPQAQDTVAKAKLAEYRQKYGDRAASAWFAGENGMNNAGAKDVNGTSVAQYQQKFQAGMPAQGSDLPAAPGQPRADGSGNATPPPQSAVPDVPRPPPTPDQIDRYSKLIESRALTPAQADAALRAEQDKERDYLRENRRLQWKQEQDAQTAKTKAETELNQKAPMELITKRVDNYENKVRPAAMAAVNEIPVIHQARQILDAGAFTGTGAGAKTFLSKLGEQIGIPSEEAQNTQVLGSVLAKRTLAASGGTLGTGFSNADRDFMEMASGGKVSLDEGAIRRILDIGERQARQTITQHDTETKRLSKVPGVAQLGEDYLKLPEAPDYKTWASANPLPQTQAAPPPAAAPGTAPPQGNIPTVNSPEEAAKLPRGTQFKTPDGRVKVVP